MRRSAQERARAQSFDRVAGDYHRLGELDRNDRIDAWLRSLLPAAGGRALDLGCGSGRHAAALAQRFRQVDAVDVSAPMIELAKTRRAQPGISYWQADLHEVSGAGCYDFVLSVRTLHHVPDLRAALSHIRTLLAPGGRLAVMDSYPPESELRPGWTARRAVHRLVPLRPRLHALALQQFGTGLFRRGPVTAWEIYRLSTTREWLDHRVTDRFFSREELERHCQALFPGYRLDVLAPRNLGLSWDAPRGPAARACP